VVDWDDEAKVFLISFGDAPTGGNTDRIGEVPFSLTTERMRLARIVAARP